MNLFNSISKRIRSLSRVDPERDWIVLLILSFITFLLVVVWNVWAFDTVAGGGVIGSSVAGRPAIFSQASLDVIHTIFDNRAAEEAKYVSGVYRYADPSL